MRIKYFIAKITNSGVLPESELGDIKRLRLVNISCLIAFLLSPLMILYGVIKEEKLEWLGLAFFYFMFILSYLLNRKGYFELASFLLIFTGVITGYWVVAVSEVQTAAVYFNILFGLLAIFVLKKKFLKILIGGIAFSSFIVLNGYQLYYKPFSLVDYSPVLVMSIATFFGIYKFSNEFTRNEEIIKRQMQEFMQLEKEKYLIDQKLKQKDIDTIVANNRMQLRLRENVLNKLNEIKEDKGSFNLIRSLKVDLVNQMDVQRRLDFNEQNIKELNADFFVRLNQKHPKLSKKERDLCSYIRLQLPIKEIAVLTNSSVNTIYVTKNRLRSKLQLSDNIEIDNYIISF